MKPSNRYDAILELPHHISQTHRRMSNAERAAQFSPFAALTGYEDAVRETARLTDAPLTLAEDEANLLDRRLQQIQIQLNEGNHPEIYATYFQPDAKKEGGSYVTISGPVKRLDPIERSIVFQSSQKVPVPCLIRIIFCSAPDQEAE